jgi:hypothetical protein
LEDKLYTTHVGTSSVYCQTVLHQTTQHISGTKIYKILSPEKKKKKKKKKKEINILLKVSIDRLIDKMEKKNTTLSKQFQNQIKNRRNTGKINTPDCCLMSR